MLAALAAPAASGATSTWIWRGSDGSLDYRTQADGDRIPDFSMVGYGAGWTDLPATPPVVLTVTATTGDATSRIQTAINSVASLPLQANGFRGTVQLAPGDYEIAGQLKITASGVVLRVAADRHGYEHARRDLDWKHEPTAKPYGLFQDRDRRRPGSRRSHELRRRFHDGAFGRPYDQRQLDEQPGMDRRQRHEPAHQSLAARRPAAELRPRDHADRGQPRFSRRSDHLRDRDDLRRRHDPAVFGLHLGGPDHQCGRGKPRRPVACHQGRAQRGTSLEFRRRGSRGERVRAGCRGPALHLLRREREGLLEVRDHQQRPVAARLGHHHRQPPLHLQRRRAARSRDRFDRIRRAA